MLTFANLFGGVETVRGQKLPRNRRVAIRVATLRVSPIGVLEVVKSHLEDWLFNEGESVALALLEGDKRKIERVQDALELRRDCNHRLRWLCGDRQVGARRLARSRKAAQENKERRWNEMM